MSTRTRRSRRIIIDLQTRPMTVVIYVRVSKDDSGKLKSVKGQEAAIRQGIADLGYPWTVLDLVYCDDDISASDKTDKERPDWERLREVVRKGQVDVVAVTEVSRLSRIARVGLDFLDDCRDHGVTGIFTAEGYGRFYRLDDPKDRSDLRHAFIAAEDESDKIQSRVGRGHEFNRKKGRQAGWWPYGLSRTFDADKEPVYTVVEDEAAIVREIITHIADGGSIATITLRLNKRGVPTRAGGPGRANKHGWAPTTVRGIASNPVYIAKICATPAYLNTQPGQRAHTATMGRDLSNLIDAPQYPRIMDDETFFRAVRNLADRPRRSFNPHVTVERGAARHLLTHIAVCECGGLITPGNRVYQASAARQGSNAAKGSKGFQKLPEGTVRERKVTRYYRCGKNMDVNVPEAAADQYVAALVISKLADLAGNQWATGYGSKELVATLSELSAAEANLEQVQALLTAELVKTKGQSAAAIKSYRDAAAQTEADISRLTYLRELQSLPEVLRPFADCGDDPEAVAKVWDSLALEAKRAVLRILADRITFKRAAHAGNGQAPVSERIDVIWNPIYVTGGETAHVTESESVQEIPGDCGD